MWRGSGKTGKPRKTGTFGNILSKAKHSRMSRFSFPVFLKPA
jgi:hypothetical protein